MANGIESGTGGGGWWDSQPDPQGPHRDEAGPGRAREFGQHNLERLQRLAAHDGVRAVGTAALDGALRATGADALRPDSGAGKLRKGLAAAGLVRRAMTNPAGLASQAARGATRGARNAAVAQGLQAAQGAAGRGLGSTPAPAEWGQQPPDGAGLAAPKTEQALPYPGYGATPNQPTNAGLDDFWGDRQTTGPGQSGGNSAPGYAFEDQQPHPGAREQHTAPQPPTQPPSPDGLWW